MKIIQILKFIINHPINENEKFRAVFQYLKWQINTWLNPFPIIYPYTEKSKLIVSKGMTGATGNLICGLHEFNDMFFLLHFLRKEDLFVDIGANIGSYTILSASHVEAQTISIEPVPSTFEHLVDNIQINRIQHRVDLLNIALGSKSGTINFTYDLDTMNHAATSSENDTIKVRVSTLDKILEARTPSLIKIDVEGFETEVINGATNTLLKEDLKAIIIELNGSGIRYGYNELEIHNKLISCGFTPCIYDPIQRNVSIIESYGKYNTIYLRDIDYVIERLKTAEKVKIHNRIL